MSSSRMSKGKQVVEDQGSHDVEVGHNEEHGGVQESQQSNLTPTTRRPPIRSDIFEKHFKKVATEEERVFQAICNYCGHGFKWKSGGGYGTLRHHLSTKHSTEIGIPTSQTQITGYASPNPTSSFQYSDTKNIEELAKLVSVEHLAFNFGEKLNFVTYCQNALNPSAKRIPRTTLTRTIKKLYNKGKIALQTFFHDFKGRVSLCFDIWSDHWQTHSYLGVTCHWVDDEWNIQKRIIAYRVFDESHSAHNLWKMMNMILEEYSLVRKIFSISVDNATANTVAINELENLCLPSFGGKFFHVRCACHIINLSVQDGIHCLDIFLSPIKYAISILWTRSNLRKEWGKFCKNNNMRPKRFPRDVPNRWNSTYELLHESLPYKDLLCKFFSTCVSNVVLLPHHWVVCEKIVQLLGTFNNATHILSGVYYPTAHLLVMECVNISCMFEEYFNDEQLHACIMAMSKKWLKYFENIPQINLVASVFNPNVKLEGLYNLLFFYYENMNPYFEMSLDSSNLVSSIISNVRKNINDLMIEYGSNILGITSTTFQTPPRSMMDHTKYSKADLLILQKQKRSRVHTNFNIEFDMYLTSSFELGEFTAFEFPIMQWWKDHCEQFPIMSAIAKDIFASPVSTVAVEQAFSAGGDILDDHRFSMTPESLEAQACLDDWTKAERRQQELTKPDMSQLYDFDTDATGSTHGSDE